LGVKYDNNVTPLTSSTFPLFTGSVEAPNINQYKYVALEPLTGNVIEEEAIVRTYSENNSKINEVYNRTNKNVEIPEFPKPFKAMFKMGTEKFKPLPKNEIFNVYAKCEENGYNDISNNPFIQDDRNDKLVNCTINIVSPNMVFQSEGSIHVIGFGSREYKKLSFGLKFNKKFLGRKAIKIRAMASDPSLIRENLTTELFKSVGVPVQEGTYARLFINNDVYGLYYLVDSFSSKWIANYIHGDPKYKVGFEYRLVTSLPEGPIADLKYKGEDYLNYDHSQYILDEYEKENVDPNNPATGWSKLIEFTRLYDSWVKNYGKDNSEKAIQELEKFFNIESVLRLMVIESLVVAIDNFYLTYGNASLYYNPERKKFQFIPFDFDQTMVGSRDDPMIGPDFMKDCITWVNYDESIVEHFFTNNLLSHPQIKERYNVILAKTSREVFEPTLVSNFVHAIADLIKEDVQWNFDSIDKLGTTYNGRVNHYSLKEFEDNLEYGHVLYDPSVRTEDTPYGIKEWVEQRGGACKAATANVDTSKNENISDNYDISGSISKFSQNISFLLVISQFILFFFF